MDGDTETSGLPVLDIEDGRDSPPQIPIDSPGSSVSSAMKDEYQQLLKYTAESTPCLNSILPSLQDMENVQSLVSNNNANAMAATRQDLLSDILGVNKNETNNNNNTESEICKKLRGLIDVSVEAMGGKLDDWLGVLKENILEELLSSLMSVLVSQHDEHKKATEGIQAEKASLQKEMNSLNEQINSLEHSLKQKGTLVKNLTDCLDDQKKKVDTAKHFYCWKADHVDKQQETYSENLAKQHHERKLNLRVLKAWYGLIQTRWRGRVERKCQSQAKEICLNLTSDYENKIGMLNKNIAALEEKVSVLQAEREVYSEQVKKAFLRGMCALNMETMSVFGDDNSKQNTLDITESTLTTHFEEISTLENSPHPESLEMVASEQSNNAHHIQYPTPSSSHYQTRIGGHQQQQNVSFNTKSNIDPKVTKSIKLKSGTKSSTHAKILSTSQVLLAPPMASVVVERHPPVNKKTVGKAMAVRFPKKNEFASQISSKCKGQVPVTQFKPLAGQTRDSKLQEGIARDISIKVVD